jgi:hypothetical protein
MDFPAIETRAFPGNREEAYRAGITPRMRSGTLDSSKLGGGLRDGYEEKIVGRRWTPMNADENKAGPVTAHEILSAARSSIDWYRLQLFYISG